MNISFVLNGKNVTVNTPPERRVIDLLRDGFSLVSVRGICGQGLCGKCTILCNGETAFACLLPAFTIKGASIQTMEGIAKTREYADIRRGLKEANYSACPYCEGARILSIFALLDKNPSPSPEDILESVQGIVCECGDWDALISGVTKAAGYIRRRKRARKR